MNIGIIGAGFTGLSAAYTLLKQGHTVSVFEKDPKPGGLAIGYQEKEWAWSLEKHYHHWFTNDNAVLNLAQELHYQVLIKRPKTSTYIQEHIYQLDSPSSLLRFPVLPLKDRLQMASVLAFLRYNPFWQTLEGLKASAFLEKTMGKNAYSTIWEPLLKKKFGTYASDISLAWFWARIKKRTPSLAYPQKGFLTFAETLVAVIKQKGGSVNFEDELTTIISEKTPEIIVKNKQGKNIKHSFDKIIVTLPSALFLRTAHGFPSDYQNKILRLKSIGATNLVLRLSSPFLQDNSYWLNICDMKAPLMAVVEHTNFMDKKNYNNEHIVYLGNYLPMNHRYFSMTKQAVLAEYHPFLQRLSPAYKKSLIGFELFTAAFAQPIIPIYYSKIKLPFQTPLKHVYLANMQQVYPWDRGTNYAISLGEEVVNYMFSSDIHA